LIIVRVGLGVSENGSGQTTMVGAGSMGKMVSMDSNNNNTGSSFPVQFENTIVIANQEKSGWDAETIV
jgi:hypothetical protein